MKSMFLVLIDLLIGVMVGLSFPVQVSSTQFTEAMRVCENNTSLDYIESKRSFLTTGSMVVCKNGARFTIK